MKFVHPRTCAGPHKAAPKRPPATSVAEIDELRSAIREGRLYDVEDWIQQGKPIQFLLGEKPRGRPHTPMQIAVEYGQFDIVRLLLCNGYDLSIDWISPLELAIKKRKLALANLLLDWGADPHAVTLYYLCLRNP